MAWDREVALPKIRGRRHWGSFVLGGLGLGQEARLRSPWSTELPEMRRSSREAPSHGLTPPHCPPRQLLGARVHPDVPPALLHHHGHHQPLDVHRPAGLLLRGPPLQQGLGDTDPPRRHVPSPSPGPPNPDPAARCSTTGHRSGRVLWDPRVDRASRTASLLTTRAPRAGSLKNGIKTRSPLL